MAAPSFGLCQLLLTKDNSAKAWPVRPNNGFNSSLFDEVKVANVLVVEVDRDERGPVGL